MYFVWHGGHTQKKELKKERERERKRKKGNSLIGWLVDFG